MLGDFDGFETFTYTPEPGYHGPDSFMVTASDGLADSNIARVTITVLGPNSPPSCVSPLTLRVPVNGTLPLTALTACSDPDGGPVSPELVTARRHGKLAFSEDGIAYVPDRNYAGPDRIDYRVTDERGARSNVAVLDIVVGDDQGPVVTTSKMPDTIAPTASVVVKPGPAAPRRAHEGAQAPRDQLRSRPGRRATLRHEGDRPEARARAQAAGAGGSRLRGSLDPSRHDDRVRVRRTEDPKGVQADRSRQPARRRDGDGSRR